MQDGSDSNAIADSALRSRQKPSKLQLDFCPFTVRLLHVELSAYNSAVFTSPICLFSQGLSTLAIRLLHCYSYHFPFLCLDSSPLTVRLYPSWRSVSFLLVRDWTFAVLWLYLSTIAARRVRVAPTTIRKLYMFLMFGDSVSRWADLVAQLGHDYLYLRC